MTESIRRLGIALMILSTTLSAGAEERNLTAEGVVLAVNNRDDGATLQRYLSMELINAKGKVRRREAQVLRKTDDTQRRTIIRFEAPRAVKDMSFLTYDETDPNAGDKQWLYLPAMKKTRRIPASNLNDSFMGTVFSYRDIKDEFKIDEQAYTFSLISTDADTGRATVRGVVLSDKERERMGHDGFVVTVDTRTWLPDAITYFDRNGGKIKTIELAEIDEIDGIWTPGRIEAVDHVRGDRTVFHYRDTQYHMAINDSEFAANRLGR